MPICNKPAIPLGSRKGSTEIDDHASEAAKLKRAREQAYFNSYNFDAIEVLPCDNMVNDKALKNENCGSSKQLSSKVEYENVREKTLVKFPKSQLTNGCSNTIPAKINVNEDCNKTGDASNTTTSSSSSSSSRSRMSLSSNNISSTASSGPSNSNNKTLTMKYAYLQRLGAFFVSTSAHQTEAGEQPVVTSAEATVNAVDGNFLLPRAMLKYQNSVGATNSMPLTVLATTQQSQPLPQQQLHNSVGKTPQNDSNKITNSHKSMLMANSARLPNGNEQHETELRLNYKTMEEDTNTGFLTLNENLAKMKCPQRNKKQSTTSATTSATGTVTVTGAGTGTRTVSASSIENLDPTDGQSTTNVVIDIMDKRKSNTTKSSLNSINHCSTMAIAIENVEPPGRAHSHQSHYSTDKSGSSGYYSSNVCSTYSIEDHIYCEPVIDILDLNGNSKSGLKKQQHPIAQQQLAPPSSSSTQSPQRQSASLSSLPSPPLPLHSATVKVHLDEAHESSQTRAMNGIGYSQRLTIDVADENENDEDDDGSDGKRIAKCRGTPQDFSEKLRILETSIDNLDRHLKNFPSLLTQDRIVSFVQTHHSHFMQAHEMGGEKARSPFNNLLPTIMEGYDPAANQSRPWQNDITDDSLLDIDLDSFLLSNEAKERKRKTIEQSAGGIDNPNFVSDDELEENNYKCVKYINSCPDNAYRVESDIGAPESRGSASQKSISTEHYLRRYEDQLHFQNTRELLEDVRDKIRILSNSNSDVTSNNNNNKKNTNSKEHNLPVKQLPHFENGVPKELGLMIKTLKSELESYLDRMNQHSEYEIRQLCSGLVKNENIMKMKKAFERRRSVSEYDYYEAIRNDPNCNDLRALNAGVPHGIRQQIASIRCASDPNFKMKRKSLTEVFPSVNCYLESIHENRTRIETEARRDHPTVPERNRQTQMQRNLSFHKPILNQFDTKMGNGNGNGKQSQINEQSQSGSSTDNALSGEPGGDKDSMLDWHRKKPSIWEMYYGTNRMHQSLLGKRNGMVVNVNQSTMSYPSSRPESDFTLDLPRAEQLRIKMEKEKKFRQRCRFITTFLSLVFFLLTVMVVSLVLTRGKRMFGSMI